MRTFTLLAFGAGIVFLALILPNHPGTMRWGALNRFPLELPVILCGLGAIGRKWGIPALVALILTLTTFLKLADYSMFSAYNRTFNPILDAFLIEAGIGLLTDSLGRLWAWCLIAAALVLLTLWYFALLHGLRAWTRLDLSRALRTCAAALALVFAGWAVADAGHSLSYWEFKKSPPGTAWTSRLTFKRGVEMQATARDLVTFAQEAATDPFADITNPLDKLAGRDVILIYIESYGRASFDNPLYAPTHLATLAKADAQIKATGLDIRSGWLASPTAGGQSWLAHGTLASGLWTSDNGRYNAMLASGHKWLFHFAQDAGYRTATFMPAITVGWPESSKMGFELIFPAADIPYKGERFNWVTMPDQFTLAAYPDLLPSDPRPDFIQIALISSHAPWVPIPDMVAWDDLGDGRVFNTMAQRGPSPRELWKDYDNVRAAYRDAVDYSLQATFEHVAHLGDDAPLIMVVGDHQAAGFVAGSDNQDVPFHMIGPTDVLDHLDDWDLTPGMVPAADAPVRKMDRFRNMFIQAFTSNALLAQAVAE